ncbi:hypothetical protein RclHR1_15650001 [Rhizophagus clarus]|nr:hypothetical protein RclHR1_15650001 [Rhizophagus clarus]
MEIARLLNNRIDVSHIPDHRFPYHYNVQHLIRQQIIQQSVGLYQQNTIPRQSFETTNIQPIFQEYSDNSTYDVSSIPLAQQPADYQQNTIPQQSFDAIRFEFYLPLPNDIYHITYTELNSIEIARLLNNRIDLSHVSNHSNQYHCNVQNLIQQQNFQQPVGYQQDIVPQQSFDTMHIQPTFQEYSDDNIYDISSVPPIQRPVDCQQDIITQQSFDTIEIQPAFQEYSDNNVYDAASIPEDISG